MSDPSSGGRTILVDPSQETDLRLGFVQTLLNTALYGAWHTRSGTHWVTDVVSRPGAYVVVFLTSTHFLLERRKREGGQTLMLAYSVFTFILATISVSSQAQVSRVTYVDSLFRDVALVCDANIILLQVSQFFLVLTGDALLVRRPGST
jgi:hypothetical protein